MEIRQLKYFVEISRCGSFAQAAEICFISPAGISLAINRLESELRCKLFERTKKGVTLTEHGRFLLPYATDVVRQIDFCEEYFARSTKKQSCLKLAFSIGTLEEFGGRVLSRFQQENSHITTDIREETDTACDAAVLSGEAELGLTVGPLHDDRLDTELLFSTQNALLVHESHPLAHRTSISVRELEGVPMTLQRDSTRSTQNFLACCRAFGFTPVIDTFVDDVLLLFYLSDIGRAAGIASVRLAERIRRRHIRVIPFEDPELAWNIYLIRKKGADLSPAAREFEKMLLQAVSIGTADEVSEMEDVFP